VTTIPDGGTLGLVLEAASAFTIRLRTHIDVEATLEVSSTKDGRLRLLVRDADHHLFDLTLTKGPSGGV
jgi:hypothetical protein